MTNKAQQLIVCKNFKLIKKLGTGAFGQIYLAENRSNTSEKYAAKLQQTTSKFPQLYYEAKMYKYLSSFGPVVGFPKVHAVTTEGQYNIMLMDLLGSSLEDLFVQNGKKLSLKTVLQVGEQLIDRIQALHEKNILHRDIKPDNFLIGTGKNAHIVYIVDFGLSKKYIQDNKHIPYKQGKQLTGTARYASINTHMGIQQSRRDDIQAIGYVLMYLLRGILPWQNMKAKDTKTKYKMIMEKKISTPAEFLCKGFPNQFAAFINYAKNLKFQEKPDYKYLKGLMQTARKGNKIQMDYVYDWTIKSTTNNLTLDIPVKSEQKVEKPKPKEEKPYEAVKIKKEEPAYKIANTFQLNGGGLLKTQQTQQSQQSQTNGIKKDVPKEIAKSLNKSGQVGPTKAGNTILGSVGMQTLMNVKIMMPKISVVRK